MPKSHSLYVCQQCGYETGKWMGKCPNCGTWNSLVETVVQSSSQNNKNKSSSIKPTNLSEIKVTDKFRVSTKIEELDRALGGGIVNGQVILIAGIPGIGKSTLLLQIADNLKKVLYVSGEESVNQIALRAQRLGIKNKELNILETTDIDSVLATAQNEKPDLLIVDSIQTMATTDLSGMAGSVGQVRECAFRVTKFAKSTNTPTFIVGHVTKEGTVGGPAVLAHIVDTVLWFEGDKNLTLRMIKATKNRFGPSDEVGVFQMEEKGLISLTNPEKTFLTEESLNAPGRIATGILQGTRPILIEIESLVVETKLPFPRHVAQGIDSKRLEILIAVLTRRCKVPLYNYDCYVNVAGGVSSKDPSIDLAICLSLASSFYDIALANNLIAIGEVGLLGEIRKTNGEERIIKLSKVLGFKNITGKSLSQVIHSLFSPKRSA